MVYDRCMMIRTNIYLTKWQVEFLNKLKDETGTPVAQSIRRILDERIESTETLEKAKKEDDPKKT